MKFHRLFVALVFCLFAPSSRAFSADVTQPNPVQAFQKLTEGNKRFVVGLLSGEKARVIRREEVAKAQHPFAVIVGCSDSRVPPEFVFDQGLGDLFVIRLAGNTVDEFAVGSIEYALEHLGSTLVVVLGHKRCGAVGAALEQGKVEAHLEGVVKAIMPAVEKVRGKEGDVWETAVKENALMAAAALGASEPVIAPLAKAGKVRIVAAYYDLDTGVVTFLK